MIIRKKNRTFTLEFLTHLETFLHMWILKILKLAGKIVLWILSGVLLIVTLILLLIQTKTFKEIIRDRATVIANEQLNAHLSIGEIDGNYFTNLQIRQGSLKFGDTTAIAFEELSLSYSLWDLLEDRVSVPEIRLRRPYARVEIDSAGVLNFTRIAKPSQVPPDPIDSNANPLGGFKIALNAMIIEEGNFDIETPMFRGAIKNFNFNLKASASGKKQTAEISRLNFSAFQYRKKATDSLIIKNITLKAEAHALPKSLTHQKLNPLERDSLWAKISEFRIVTEKSDIFSRGNFVLPDSAHGIALNYETDLRLYPFSLYELKGWVPGLPDIDKVELDIHASGNDLYAEIPKLKILTSAGTLNGSARVDLGNGPIRYNTQLAFDGINPGAFLNRQDLYAFVSGQFMAKGEGSTAKELKSIVSLDLYKSRALGVDIEKFTINADVKGGLAKLTKFEGRTSAGYFNCEGFFNLNDESYRLETKLSNLNIADLMGDASKQSSINLALVYDGKGLNPKTMSGKMFLSSDSSKILGRDLQNFTVKAGHASGKIYLDNLQIKTPFVNLGLKGTMGLDSTVDLRYSLETVDFSLLKRYIGNDSLLNDSLNLKLQYEGGVSGNFKKLKTDGTLTLKKFIFGELKIDSLRFSYFADNLSPSNLQKAFDFRREDSTIVADVFLYSHLVEMNGLAIRDFSASITKEKGKSLFEVSVYEDILQAFASIKGNLALENEKRGQLLLDELQFRIAGRTLRTREVTVKLGDDPIIDSTYEKWVETWKNNKTIDLFFDIEKNSFDVRSLSLDIGKGLVSVFGQIDIAGDQNLDIKIKDLDLSRANTLIGSKSSVVEGLLNFNGSLKGSFEKPIFLAEWNIEKGKASEFVYDNFLGNLQYLNRKVQLNMTLNQNRDKTMTIGGFLPIDLAFKDVKERFSNRPMNFKIHSEGVDLRFLQAFFGKNLTLNRGDLKVDLTVSGNKEKPKLEGEIKVENGTLTFPRTTLGQTFRNATILLHLTPEKIFLDTLSLQSGKDTKSNLFASGSIDLTSILKNFDFNNIEKISYQIETRFNNFIPINTKSETAYLHTAVISGKMMISAPSLYYTNVKGDLQIKNSEIWVVDPTKAKISASVSSKKSETKSENNFYKNLDLDLNVDLPENSENAIRSAEMLLTLFGNIGVTKPPGSEDFFINGDVNTKPGGKYAYLSIAFLISKGVIVFTGAPGVNPNLDIEAVKKFDYKDEDGTSIPSEAKIQVKGTLLKPEIAIIAVERGSDNPLPDLTEPADILTYLVLGVKTKDITKVSGSQASNFAQQVAVNQVLNMVANQAGLSKLEYTPSATGGAGATIEVGKRISETVSVNFSGGNDPTVGQILTLEVVADSIMNWVTPLRSWKKTFEFEYKQAPKDKTDQPDILNLIFFFRKEY